MKDLNIFLFIGILAGVYMLYGTGKRKLSINGLNELKQFEGLRLEVYNDAAGKPTIGYGHLIKPGESFPPAITKATALRLLSLDVAFAENAVNDLVSVPLSQTQFDALVSFTYNVGAGAFERSTVLALLNDADYIGATDELSRWVYAGGNVVTGLVNRRQAEQALFWG